MKQTAEASASRPSSCAGRTGAANKAFFAASTRRFSEQAADLLLEIGVIRQKPDIAALADPRFVQ